MSAAGDMDGGSTGWSNSARSRWSLSRPKGEDGEPADTNERVLTKRKANYSAIGDDIKLRWISGVLVSQARLGAAFAGAAKQIADDVFLRMLRRSYSQERWVSLSRNATNFAPKVFAKAPDAEGHSAKDFSAAMERLLHDRKVKTETYGRFGHQRLAPCDEPGGEP
jgi:RecA-family ATPase